MSTEASEQIRLSILRHLASNPTRFGITSALLLQYLRSEGAEVDQRALDAEILYLEDKYFVVEITKGVSPAVRAFRITSSGRDVFERSGHAR